MEKLPKIKSRLLAVLLAIAFLFVGYNASNCAALNASLSEVSLSNVTSIAENNIAIYDEKENIDIDFGQHCAHNQCHHCWVGLSGNSGSIEHSLGTLTKVNFVNVVILISDAHFGLERPPKA